MESDFAAGDKIIHNDTQYEVVRVAGANVICQKDGIQYLFSIKDVKKGN